MGAISHGRLDELAIEEPLPGVRRSRFDGDRATVLVYWFEPGARHGLHSHSEEQLMIVQEGAITLRLENGASSARAGDYVVVPSGVVHGVDASADGARLLVVIAPRRTADYVIQGAPGASVRRRETAGDRAPGRDPAPGRSR